MDKELLISLIKKHDELYWKKGTPEISDFDYDILVESLKDIDPNHPLVNKINTPTVASEGKVIHKVPMRSLEKVYTIEELVKWCGKVARSDEEMFVIEYKYDGCSATLIDGVLATRGDGNVGEDITSKLPIINIIGTKNTSNVRGEVLMLKSVFSNIKDEMGFKNTRNSVAGILNRDDVDIKHGKILTLVPFRYFSAWFMMEEIKRFLNDSELFDNIVKSAMSSDFPTDGLVVKLANKKYLEELGATSHHSKGEIAFKFANPTGKTVLLGIEWSIGKHVITPVGKVAPVEISGVTVSNVNLHNMGYINAKNIHIGDTLIIERAGDVIPDVLSVIPGKSRKKITLDNCPYCGEKVNFIPPVMVCINEKCSGKLLHRLMDSVVRIGIERLGLPSLKKIVDNLHVVNLIDIFDLTLDEIRSLDGFAAKSSENLLEEIQKVVRRNVEDWRILSCLNLEGIGTTLSKTLLSEFSLNELRNMTEKDFTNIAGIGPERAVVLVNGLKVNFEYIDMLLNKLTVMRSKENKSAKNSGKIKICFTGKFPKPKSYYYGLLGNDVYEVVERLESDTKVLVVADPSIESSKTKAAKKKGISIIGIYDLFDKNLLNQEA